MKINNTTQQANCSTTTTPSHAELEKAKKCRQNQIKTILSHLKQYGRISTIEAYQMFILSPSACIYVLRQKGYNIKTVRDYDFNGMAVYVLESSEVKS